MNQESFKKEFAYMFKVDSREPINLFGIEAPDGWNHLLFNLFNIIALIDVDQHVRVEQIKSKMAGLRFYFTWMGPERKRTLHDLYVNLVRKLPWRMRKLLGNPSKKWNPIHEQIYNIVSLFEEVSYNVCETCGEPAKLRNKDGWLYTLCDSCFREIILIQALEKTVEEERLLISGHFQPEDV